MLAGLLFAVQGAEDRPGSLVATLPFAGVTLIEYQARLLIEAGVTQIVVVVARLTPELVGATARIARAGVAVDSVRTAADAMQKLHPLARVIVMADGLVATAGTIAPLADGTADMLLTLDASASPAGFERVGGDAVWAGAAAVAASRIAEVAALPADYDVQSTIVRVAAQAGARQVVVSPDAVRGGHGIERSGGALEARGRALLAATVSGRRGWFDRHVVAPVARASLPVLMNRHVSTKLAASVTGLVAAIGLALTWYGHGGAGLLLALVGGIGAAAAAALAWMRDEMRLRRGLLLGSSAIAATGALLLGRASDLYAGEVIGLTMALAGVVIGTLAGRAAREHRRRAWWGSPLAYLAVMAGFALVGWPVAGLAIAAAYATATAAAAIEDLRRQP